MRPLIISTLAVTLTGCTWFAPQQAQQASLMGHSTAGTPRTNSNTVAKAEIANEVKTGHLRRGRKADSNSKIAKPNTVPKMDASSCIQPDDKSSSSMNPKPTEAERTETPQSAQPNDKSDPVLKKAMPTIAAKMENSSSVELVEMKRAEKMRLVGLSTPFAAASEEKAPQAQKLETGRFYTLSMKTRRTSAVTIWRRPRTIISAINDGRHGT
jgi:hypothetical protein